jgi:CRISPR-associated endonuclease/helicase Cas3
LLVFQAANLVFSFSEEYQRRKVFWYIWWSRPTVTRPFLELWAKIGAGSYPERYHPLLTHLQDVAAVALSIWSRCLRPSLQSWVAATLQVPADDAGRWLAFWAGAHDIGKAAASFQDKDPGGRARALLGSLGFAFHHVRDVPHGVLTARVLGDLLAQPAIWPALTRTAARRVGRAVGGHHGIFPTSVQAFVDLGTQALGAPGSAWETARLEVLGLLGEGLGLGSLAEPRPPAEGGHGFYMFLAGMCSVADWVGSNTEFFPPAGPSVEPAAYLSGLTARAGGALQALGWTGWRPEQTGPLTFSQLFGFAPRPLQQVAEGHAAGMDGPGLVIAEAPMGEGKTEAALFLADRWLQAHGHQGLYLALPTQATSNQMFDRVTRFLEARYQGQRVQMHLLHGQALLSEAYEDLRREAEAQRQAYRAEGVDEGRGNVVASAWFAQNRKQGLLAPFAVGTVDQALLAVLQTRHAFVRLFGLAGKVVVLDEVHAYDVYMSALLERLLGWLAALRCPVVLLSATLPASRRSRLVEAYAAGVAAPVPAAQPAAPYPRLTSWQPGRGLACLPIPVSPERRQRVELSLVSPERLGGRLEEALAGGGCAAVLCNTVRRAQQVFGELRGLLEPLGVEVGLFHARFLFGRRQAIEAGVLRRFGKDHPDERPRRAVLVATQVIEQSLDLDFDLMFTDVAPIDLVLQRAGRLHRHRDRRRPELMRSPVLGLLQPAQDGHGVPTFGVDELVYDRHVLLRSWLALQRPALDLPDEIEPLIESVYGAGRWAGLAPPWRVALEGSRQGLEQKQSEHTQLARQFAIPSPLSEDDVLDEFCRDLEEDNPDLPPGMQAFTRLSRPSAQAVFLFEREGRLHLTPGGREIDLAGRPTLQSARLLLRNSLTIQHAGVVRELARQPAPDAWRQSGLLRHHRLVVVGPSGSASVAGYRLTPDPDLGLLIESAGGQEDADQ